MYSRIQQEKAQGFSREAVSRHLGKCNLLETNIAILNEVLGDIELTPEEENSLMWLAGWEKQKAERSRNDSRSNKRISGRADSR